MIRERLLAVKNFFCINPIARDSKQSDLLKPLTAVSDFTKIKILFAYQQSQLVFFSFFLFFKELIL